MLRFLSAFAIVFCVALAGCGGGTSPESFARDQATARQEIGKILEGITDESAATDALPKIEAEVNRINDLQEKINALNLSSDKAVNIKKQQQGPNIDMLNKLDALKERSAAAHKIVAAAMEKIL